MSARRLTTTMFASLCALVGALVFGSAGAQAMVTHRYLSSPITEVPAKGPPPAEEAVAFPGPLQGFQAMTFDSGELYLIDEEERLDKFNASTGAFIAQFPRPAKPYGHLHYGVAVGHGTGETEVYVGADEFGAEIQGRVAVYNGTGHLQGFWDGSDTPAGHFGCYECGEAASGSAEYGAVAADDSGNLTTKGRVYVLDPKHGVVDVFEPQAGGGEKYLTQITGPEPKVPFGPLGAALNSVAVDQLNGNLLVREGTSDQSTLDVFEATALGEYVLVRRLTGTPAGPFGGVSGITTDGGSGDIYVWESEAHPRVVDQFNSTGVYLGHLTGTPAGGFGSLGGVAVDPTTGDVYVGDTQSRPSGVTTSVDVFGPSIVIPDVTTAPASGVKPRSATLNGTVNPDAAGAAMCHFEWGTSASFGHVAPCEPEAVPDGNSPVAVHAALSGLQTDTTYYYRLVASDNNGTNPGEALQNQQFATPGPGIDQEAASVVTSASATLDAAIDPDNASTTYYFQYGTSTAYGATVPAQPGLGLGAGKGDVAVSVHLQGLAAGTVYHYRVVALSEVEGEPVTVEGPDQTFATQATGTETTQPDGRQWEMVSPPAKQGASIVPIGNESGALTQASAEGGAITYVASGPFVANPAGSRTIEATQVTSVRHAPGSWGTADITTRNNREVAPVAVGHSAAYKLFSTDLSQGLVEPDGCTPLAPLLPSSIKTLYLRASSGEFTALVSPANGAPGVAFECGTYNLSFAGASPDLGHVVLQSQVKLTSAPTPAPAGASLLFYEWADGQLQPASVLPNHEFAESAALGVRNQNVRHAVSDDGSRVVFTGTTKRALSQGVNNLLYLRDMARQETVQVSAAQGTPELDDRGRVEFQTASSDDSRVFFTSADKLTADSTAAGGPEDLYVFEVTSGKSEPFAGKLTDLTVDGNAQETAAVQGVVGASEDGSLVYFVANGVLGDGAEHGAAPGGNNLYVESYDAGAKAWAAPKLIAALANGDINDWSDEGNASLTRMTARVSPDGQYLTFMSERSLTGYENRDANSGEPDEEVFLYDANTGRTICASCNRRERDRSGSKSPRKFSPTSPIGRSSG
jgi:hypothetical protein